AARVWTVPGSRMKAGREHRVPLSDAAVALLGALPKPHKGLVFVKRGKPLGAMALVQELRRMGHGSVTVHGFRSSFTDWAHERTACPSEAIELALAHVVANRVEAAYRRGDQFEKRRRLMDAWAEHCAGKGAVTASVTKLHG